MNTNPSATTILCYGDSNTWGQKPDRTGRYPVDIRWTGILQNLLGNDCYIIEEGLNSRTTDLDYARKPGRNGKAYLQPCVESHSPVDRVLIMLGTNDLKIDYGRSVKDIAVALEGLVQIVREYGKDYTGSPPKITLISPILIDSTAINFTEFYTGYYDERSAAESKLLANEIQILAQRLRCDFIDAASVAKSGEDGIHLDEESNKALAQLIASEIKEKNEETR